MSPGLATPRSDPSPHPGPIDARCRPSVPSVKPRPAVRRPDPRIRQTAPRVRSDRKSASADVPVAARLQVVDDRVGSEPEIGPTQMPGHVGMTHGHPAHVALVDHGSAPRHAGGTVVAPAERGLEHAAFGHVRRAVAPVLRQVAVVGDEGALALGLYCSRLVDEQDTATPATAQARATAP